MESFVEEWTPIELFVEQWTSIANIVVQKNFEQQFREDTSLQPLDDEDDECKKYNVEEECEKQPMCVVYTDSKEKKTCVPKKRVKSFSTGTIILGVNGARFKILYTEQYDHVNEHVYVYILLSIDTNILYVLWSSKLVLEHSKIVSIDIDELINQLRIFMETVNYVIFCGHSMGCVLSQYLAIKCVGVDLDISKINVIGSGPFSWMENNDLEILTSNYQDRIHIFVVGYLDTKKKKFCVDPFFFRNAEKEDYSEDYEYDEENYDEENYDEERFDINQYYPCKVLVIQKPSNFDSIDISEHLTCIGTKIIKDKTQVAKFEPNSYDRHWRAGCPLHELNFYMKCLKEQLQIKKRGREKEIQEIQEELQIIKQKIGGRRKKTKHIKRKNRKKYTKKSKI